MQNDFSFIIMGSTGDLAQKKLFPAMYGLYHRKEFGENFCIIGVGRRKIGREEFVEGIREKIKISEENWRSFSSKIHYFSLDFEDSHGYIDLKDFIEDVEKKSKLSSNRLFYLATLPQHFENIAKNLKEKRLAETNGWCRVVFEKPFGEDLKTARLLNSKISKAFDENQIYRIDHYLGKELVQSISVLRACNRIFAPLWNKDNIDHVQINLIEDFGVETRGEFYDKEGSLKDVGQSHLLQLLALIAMEPPKRFDEKCIRDSKVKVLRSISKIKKEDLVLGQYQGYLDEKGVNPFSKTDTFFALKLFINNNRWKGVPFYLRSGKNLAKKFSSIYIQFKEPDYNVFEGQNIKPNYLLIQIQPEDGILLQLNSKMPGQKNKILPVKMTFCHECTFGPNTPKAYETLLLDVLKGDQSAFMRADEIEESWRLIDQAISLKKPIHVYEKGSFGPKEANELIEKDGREWFNKIENMVQGL
jgi:glucose-6-phosphate 1-dehydrogenase